MSGFQYRCDHCGYFSGFPTQIQGQKCKECGAGALVELTENWLATEFYETPAETKAKIAELQEKEAAERAALFQYRCDNCEYTIDSAVEIPEQDRPDNGCERCGAGMMLLVSDWAKDDLGPAIDFYVVGRNWNKLLKNYLKTHPGKVHRKRCHRCGLVAIIAASSQEMLDNAELQGRHGAVICDKCEDKQKETGTITDLGMSEEQVHEVHKINMALDARARRN